MRYIPEEIVNLIADYHDYDKYCKPIHQINYQHVLKDITDMGNAMTTTLTDIVELTTIHNNISPSIAYTCWNKFGWSKYINQFQFDTSVFDEEA